MNSRGKLKATLFRLPADLENGIKTVAARRGEAIAVVARQLLREALTQQGVIRLVDHDRGPPELPSNGDSATPNAGDFR